LVGTNDGPVDAIEHQIQVWHASRVTAEQLEDAPNGEEVSCLEGRRNALDVGAATDHDEPEVGRGASAVDHRTGDSPGDTPWVEVLMDVAEVGGAGGGIGTGRQGGGHQRGVGDGGAGSGGVGGEQEGEGLGYVAGTGWVARQRR
jgi:hypothetical protein